MDVVCVFIKYNGQWDDTSRYVSGEMKGILVALTATYIGLIELVRSVIGMKGLEKTIVMRYVVKPGMPPVRIQCDANVNFYIQLKKKDVHSDEDVQPAAVNNLIIPSPILTPIPPPIPSSIVCLDLHMEDGLEEQDEFLNNDLSMNHDDCNVGEFNVEEAARDSNEKNIVGSIGA
ncbi:hypothetical protein TIFTF001_016797 [Ficus carica]|uniref:Uncharacterized protein n=1 Tax=Ficus carica TaxID=3494 RepID=A0AA88A3T1_FICCA|nr:hypothetical protein TIFTF001_016797 [Ficus carica]